VTAFDDPFSGELQPGEERIAQPFSWGLVHRGDLVAFLAGHEGVAARVDSLEEEAPVSGGRGRRRGPVAESDRRRIERWCGFVRSTLRDALMIGASDIHLETLPAGSPSSSASTASLAGEADPGSHRGRAAIARVKCSPSSTSPSAACRRTGASRRSSAAARSISASRSVWVAVPALALAATGFAVRNRA